MRWTLPYWKDDWLNDEMMGLVEVFEENTEDFTGIFWNLKIKNSNTSVNFVMIYQKVKGLKICLSPDDVERKILGGICWGKK